MTSLSPFVQSAWWVVTCNRWKRGKWQSWRKQRWWSRNDQERQPVDASLSLQVSGLSALVCELCRLCCQSPLCCPSRRQRCQSSLRAHLSPAGCHPRTPPLKSTRRHRNRWSRSEEGDLTTSSAVSAHHVHTNKMNGFPTIFNKFKQIKAKSKKIKF